MPTRGLARKPNGLCPVCAWCRDAVKAMLDSNISGAPVTNAQGKLIGIISESDLIWKVTNCACP